MESKPHDVSSLKSYEDFHPTFKLKRGEGGRCLLLDLPGFKKEELKVQVDSHGTLKITGERQLEDNKCIRFRKDFHVPKSYDVGNIRARFENECLTVKLPKATIHEITRQKPTTGAKKQETETTIGETSAGEKWAQNQSYETEEKLHGIGVMILSLAVVILIVGMAIALGIHGGYGVRNTV